MCLPHTSDQQLLPVVSQGETGTEPPTVSRRSNRWLSLSSRASRAITFSLKAIGLISPVLHFKHQPQLFVELRHSLANFKLVRCCQHPAKW